MEAGKRVSRYVSSRSDRSYEGEAADRSRVELTASSPPSGPPSSASGRTPTLAPASIIGNARTLEPVPNNGTGRLDGDGYLDRPERRPFATEARSVGPPHLAAGWYALGLSRELRSGALWRRRLHDRELIVARSESGKVMAFDAHCPPPGSPYRIRRAGGGRGDRVPVPRLSL